MLKDSKISEHFTYGELTATHVNMDNTPDDEQLQCMKLLCDNVLEPIRDKFGAVSINSCFRTQSVNAAIGSKAPNSQHCKGQAADIGKVQLGTLSEMAMWVKRNISFDQLIMEECVNGEPKWVHISFNEGHNRKQILYT